MALNSNHTFEDLEGIKCAIVEKNSSMERINFLKKILEHNHFTVVVVKSLPPKTATKVANESNPVNTPLPLPETFTIGVTDLSFNPTNAIFNRELKTPEGKIVTPAYWKQTKSDSEENSWYWKK